MNIILIGFKSCGKSSDGQALAKRLAMSFVDTDSLIEQQHATAKNEPLTFREIFKQYGQVYFRALEQQVIAQLGQLDNYVIAVGGGTFINHPIPLEVRHQAKIVYLTVEPEILWQRIQAGGLPAFFKESDPRQEFYQLFSQRDPIYQQLADVTVEVSYCNVEEAIEKIQQAVGL